MECKLYTSDIKNIDLNINKLKEKLKDLSIPLTDFEKYYKGIITKNYYTDGKLFTDSGWVKYKDDYYEKKMDWVLKKKVMSNGLKATRMEKLRLTDYMRKKVMSKDSVKVSKDKIEYIVNVVYANTHQFGRGHIPARPFLFRNDTKGGLRKQDLTMLQKILEKYLRYEEAEK